jgi:hypothetical protein
MAHVSGIELDHQAKRAATRGGRWLWAAAGHVLVALGVIGAFVPLMPTTIFLILAASCYARSSARLYRWLLEHRTFGPILRDWRDHRSMRAATKRVALGAIVVAFTATFFAIPLAWVRVIHVLIGLALVGFVLRVPTRG